jgi:hypothetical protein
MMHGALCVVHDAWLRNAWCMVHDAWRMVHDTSNKKDFLKKIKCTFTRISHCLYNQVVPETFSLDFDQWLVRCKVQSALCMLMKF